MSADTARANQAIAALRDGRFKELMSDTPADPALKATLVDLIETYEWMGESRKHAKAEIDELRRQVAALELAARAVKEAS